MSGSPVEGTVVAIATDSGETFTASTDADGRFERLSPGTYEVTIDAASTPPTTEPQTVRSRTARTPRSRCSSTPASASPTWRSRHGCYLADGLGAQHAGARCVPTRLSGLKRRSVAQPEPPFRRLARTPTLWILARGRRVLRRVPRPAPRDGGEIDLSEFWTFLEDGRIRNAEILEGDQVVRGELTDGTEYVATFTVDLADDIANELREADVPIHATSQKPSGLVSLLPRPADPAPRRAPALDDESLPRRQRARDAVRSRPAQDRQEGSTKTTFKDVAGVDEAIEELEESRVPAAPVEVPGDGREDPRGVLLFGPPAPARPSSRGRWRESGCAVLLDQWVGLRRDVRRRRRRPGP